MDYPLLEQILLWILIPILVIIFLLLLLAVARIAVSCDKPKITKDLDFGSLKTGDILGVGYTHPFGWFVTAWSCSVWSHTGIVWVDPNNSEIYVLEAAMYHGIFKGVIKIPLPIWVRINRNYNIGVVHVRGKTVDPGALMDAFEARKKYVRLESYNWKWYRLLFKTPYYEEIRSKYTCYELVTTILQDVGVIAKKYTCSSYFPRQIMNGDVELCEGYIFEPPYMLDVTKHTRLRQAEDYSHYKRKINFWKRNCKSCGGD
jgi:hypothetical protein